MCASDVTATLDQALTASGLDHIAVVHQPWPLSDNGSNYVADDLAKRLEGKGMQHVRGSSRLIPRARARSSVGTEP
jgi:putative transposase